MIMINLNERTIDEILRLSTKDVQKVKWMEELAELIQAIAKDDCDAITEEMADVFISLYQAIKVYGIKDDDVSRTIERKLDRTVYRLSLKDKCMREAARNLELCECGEHPRLVMIPGSCDYMYFVECPKCHRRTKLYDTENIAAAHWNQDGRCLT